MRTGWGGSVPQLRQEGRAGRPGGEGGGADAVGNDSGARRVSDCRRPEAGRGLGPGQRVWGLSWERDLGLAKAWQ